MPVATKIQAMQAAGKALNRAWDTTGSLRGLFDPLTGDRVTEPGPDAPCGELERFVVQQIETTYTENAGHPGFLWRDLTAMAKELAAVADALDICGDNEPGDRLDEDES